MKRLATVTAGAVLVALAMATAAHAVPKNVPLTVEREFVESVAGNGCTTATVRERLPSRPVHAWPTEGDKIRRGVSVLEVSMGRRGVVWAVGPDAETCAERPGDDWTWYSGRAAWGAAYRSRLLPVVATRRDGIRSIAGFRVAPRSRNYSPSIRRARRALGKPTKVQGSRYGYGCHVRWRRLGLGALFVNFAGRPPCKRGYLQSARISGRRANRWAVIVRGRRRRPVAAGTSLRYVREERLVRFNHRSDAWALSEDYIPYGTDPGHIATVALLFHGHGQPDHASTVRGFDLWIGAGGE